MTPHATPHATKALRLAIALTLFGAASPARADGSELGALLRQGVELRRQHRNQEALAVFARAVDLSKAPPARAQLGLAEQALGLWLEAERDLDAALAATDDPWIAKNADAMKEARGVVEGHLAWLAADVDVAGADVRLDGRALPASADARVVATAGVLEVRAAGYAPDIRRIDLPAGEHVHVAITLAPLVASGFREPPSPSGASAAVPLAPPDQRPPAPEPSSKLVGPLAFGVAGLVGLGAGTYFGVRTFGYKADRDAQCVNGACTPAALTYDSEARSAATASTIAFGAGALCLAAGVTWWLVDRASPRGSHARIDVAPLVGSTNGLVIRGAL